MFVLRNDVHFQYGIWSDDDLHLGDSGRRLSMFGKLHPWLLVQKQDNPIQCVQICAVIQYFRHYLG